jgi:uncharacterized DUF497 family protein
MSVLMVLTNTCGPVPCSRRKRSPDATHSKLEARHMALGITDAGRLLFISFTVRRHLIRVISARDMTRKEAITYAHLKA